MNPRQRILLLSDRASGALIVLVLLGGTLFFGGAVWWFLPVLVAAVFLLVLLGLTRHLVCGTMPLLKSPLTFLGVLALGLGALQLAPLPARLARSLSPATQQAYTLGLLPQLAQRDDPEAVLPDPMPIRSPASLDRPATLRWLVEASACLGLFWAVTHFTDRLKRLYLVWGLVIAGFLVNAVFAVVQVVNHCGGLYGVFLPGAGPWWAPGLNDLLTTPTTAFLQYLAETAPAGQSVPRVMLVPSTPFLFGTLMGGSGAFLALGTLALPLALALVLHLVSPRGSRESLSARLGHCSQGSLVILLVILLFLSTILIGLSAGPWYSLPLALGLFAVGFPAVVLPGSRGAAFALTASLLAGVGLGVALQRASSSLPGAPLPVRAPNPNAVTALWSESLEMFREFPVLGVGLGGFSTIHPYFKHRDASSTTAMSTLIQWGVEAGATGLVILGLAGLWCTLRIPSGLRRVGSIDRSLAHGLIGAALSFSLLAAIHWTIELEAVAISVSALGGTWNRWLAGGTDLFVERG